MGKELYYTYEVIDLLNRKIHQLVDGLIADTEISPEDEAEMIRNIRVCKKFVDDLAADLKGTEG